MLMFSRNSTSTSNGVTSRDASKISTSRNSRNSYYDVPQGSKSTNVTKNGAKGDAKNGDESPTLMKRTSNRSTMKKSRPHSWHSTLQRGFQRARSRSSGRGEKNRDAVAAANGQKQNGKKYFMFDERPNLLLMIKAIFMREC